MLFQESQPRILLISQWPNIKNAEYELIEKIKQTGYKIAVVDYLGFDVLTGECLNKANLRQDYDCAISFHYDTPKFLNIPTFLWVANPLEFMYLRKNYRSVLLNNLRGYDDYLFNGSDLLKRHIRNVLGTEWCDNGLEMFPSCSTQALIPPKTSNQLHADVAQKLFYCGVNWERGTDGIGRAHGLLNILQEQGVADFYGPNKLEGMSPWEGFKSYRGEIPFDGISMSQIMRQYGAVLAISSPAHMKSKTSSSRVFEGIAAGVPVISDENAHVKKLFGDLVYYFRGETEVEKATSILAALRQINENPQEARRRVVEAQALMAQRFCFEPCFERMLKQLRSVPESYSPQLGGKQLDVFVLHHDADHDAFDFTRDFSSIQHVLEAAGQAVICHGVSVKVTVCGCDLDLGEVPPLPDGVELVVLDPHDLSDQAWDKLRVGEKISLLGSQAVADFTTFMTHREFPTHDAFVKGLSWFAGDSARLSGGLFVGGFFVTNLPQGAPSNPEFVVRNTTPVSLYYWTQSSPGEHEMGTLMFSRQALSLLERDEIDQLDVLLPISLIVAATARNMPVHRSRHLLMRTPLGHFHRHHAAYCKAAEKGFWFQHSALVTNYFHEFNILLDIHHESHMACAIIDQISGYSPLPLPPIDPAVYAVNNIIAKIRPFYRFYKKVFNFFRRKL